MPKQHPSEHGRAHTPPKGRPTPGRDEPDWAREQISLRRWRLEWGAVILVGIVLFGLVIAFGSGSGDGVQHRPVGVHGN